MNREQSWQVITEQRLALAQLLDGLSDTEWEQPSLCAGWRVRDVAAHVAMAPQVPGLGSMLADGIRARGSFHRLNHDVAARHAARPTGDIIAELRTYADSRAGINACRRYPGARELSSAQPRCCGAPRRPANA